jgi:hypothetical protein
MSAFSYLEDIWNFYGAMAGGGDPAGADCAPFIQDDEEVFLKLRRETGRVLPVLEPAYVWAYDPGRRDTTDYLILHHAAGSGSAQAVHLYHRDVMGWAGIAYHYYVRRDGGIYRGRPENWAGGHTAGYNRNSIGVCFEGDFETEQMQEEQLAAGQALISDIADRYPGILVRRHGELTNTACPGSSFPFAALVETADVPSRWAEAAAEKAVRLGIVQGSGAGHFGWKEPVSLERLLVVLDRLGLLGL